MTERMCESEVEQKACGEFIKSLRGFNQKKLNEPMAKEKKTIKELGQEVTRLAHLWYEYVSKDHHKDCDCHWYIERKWSYFEKPKWVVWHAGYIFEGGKIECKSYEEALRKLVKLIREAFQKELKWAKRVLESSSKWDELQIEQAKWLVKNCKKIKLCQKKKSRLKK